MSRRDRVRYATTDFPFPPATTGMWRGLSRAQREEWLLAARNRHFKWTKRRRWKDADPGTVFSIDGSAIADFPALLCALGEAINGPGGYFGMHISALEDCLFGGFGAKLPFVLRIDDMDGCRRSFLEGQGMHSLVDTELEGGQGKQTLLDIVLEMLTFHGVRVTSHR